jgi:hypothetical protein
VVSRYQSNLQLTFVLTYQISPIAEDAAVLEPVLYRLIGESSLPAVLLGGRSIGSPSDITKLHESGDLEHAMKSAGISIVPPKKKMAIPAPKLK